MPLFNKKKRNLEENGFSGKLPGYFKKSIEDRIMKITGWLNQKTGGYSPVKKKASLIIFCILFGGLSFYILAGSMRGRGFNNRNLIITHLHSGVNLTPSFPVSDSVFQRVVRLQKWLDSLRQNDTSKFKAILLAKPFLIDNLLLVERIYQSKSK